MRCHQATVALSALSLAACDQAPPPPPAKPAVTHSAVQAQLAGLDEMNRAIALKRAIYDSGESCRRIVKSGYVQEHGNLAMWTASCADGKKWAIFVGRDGSAQVRDCASSAELKLPACAISDGSKTPGPKTPGQKTPGLPAKAS